MYIVLIQTETAALIFTFSAGVDNDCKFTGNANKSRESEPDEQDSDSGKIAVIAIAVIAVLVAIIFGVS